jgi:prepilin-type processing-associated H-X9-DG protein
MTLFDASGNALGNMARGNYVGNFGQSEPGADVGHEGVLFRNSAVRPRDVPDGLARTFLVGERSSDLGRTSWFGLFLDVSIPAPVSVAPIPDPEHGPPMVVAHTGRFGDEVHKINDPQAHADEYRSLHAGGAHFLMCDGSVHFITDTIDASIYTAMSSKAGGETVVNGAL